MHVMYGYVEIYDITADTAKDFEIITKKKLKIFITYYLLLVLDENIAMAKAGLGFHCFMMPNGRECLKSTNFCTK